MPVKSQYTTVLLDQYNLSTQLKQANLQTNNDLIDVTPFETEGVQMIQGPIAATLQIMGFFKGVGAGWLEKELHDRLGGNHNVISAVLYGTNVMGCPAYVLPNGDAGGLQISAPAKDVITVGGSLTTSTSLKRGKRLYYGTISGTGAQAGVDFGAAGVNGGFGYLWVSAVGSAPTNATIKIQSDSDSGFGAAADEGTFTFSGVGAQQITLSGAIGRYLRINTTSMGGASSFTVQVVACVKGVTY